MMMGTATHYAGESATAEMMTWMKRLMRDSAPPESTTPSCCSSGPSDPSRRGSALRSRQDHVNTGGAAPMPLMTAMLFSCRVNIAP
jgi:hypothetical protein